MKQKPFLKAIASILALTFSWSQILWAADVRQMILDAKEMFAEEDARKAQGSSAGVLTSNESKQQAVVEQKQALQDLEERQNPQFSLTTQNGDILDYVGEKLSQVKRPDGTVLKNITTDAAGMIQNADLKLSDGSIQVFQDGKVIGYQTPEGSQVIYRDGQIQKVIAKDGAVTLYSYRLDQNNNIITTTLDSADTTTLYDSQGKLKEIIQKNSGEHLFYTGGILQSITNPDNSQILFKSKTLNDQIEVTFKSTLDGGGSLYESDDRRTLPDGSQIKNIVWNDSGQVQSADLECVDGNIYTFSNKQISSVKLADGSQLNSISWDTQGMLKDGVLTDGQNDQFNYSDGALSSIRSPDGSLIQNIVWDQAGKIDKALLTDPQNDQYLFTGGQLSQVTLPDGSILRNISWDPN